VLPLSAPLKPENVYALFAVALTLTNDPLVYQLLDGLIEPPAAGEAAVVRRYCVVKLAVQVAAEEGTVIVWDAAPPSDQLENRYCVPEDPWVPAANVCVLPGAHTNAWGVA